MKMKLMYPLLVSIPLLTNSAISAEQWSQPVYTEQWTNPAYTEQLMQNEIVFDTLPIIENGRSLVPLRKIFEILGAEVLWHGDTKQIKATKGQNVIILQLGSKTAYVNNKAVTLDVPPRIVGNRTLVPLRFVSEALGSKVDYDNLTTRVIIDDKYFFYMNSEKKKENPQLNQSNNNYIGKWAVWVPGAFTIPNGEGWYEYVLGAGGGSMNINKDGTFIWDMKTVKYNGTWQVHPNNSSNLLLKSNDGWDYTMTMTDIKTIKWYSYGLEYYGVR